MICSQEIRKLAVKGDGTMIDMQILISILLISIIPITIFTILYYNIKNEKAAKFCLNGLIFSSAVATAIMIMIMTATRLQEKTTENSPTEETSYAYSCTQISQTETSNE